MCDPGWTYHEHTEKCYKYDRRNRNWGDAVEFCESYSDTLPLSSTLASVHDSTTNEFLTALSGGQWTWLGGYQNGRWGTWQWLDGSRWTGYNLWGPGEIEPKMIFALCLMLPEEETGMLCKVCNEEGEKLSFIVPENPSRVYPHQIQVRRGGNHGHEPKVW